MEIRYFIITILEHTIWINMEILHVIETLICQFTWCVKSSTTVKFWDLWRFRVCRDKRREEWKPRWPQILATWRSCHPRRRGRPLGGRWVSSWLKLTPAMWSNYCTCYNSCQLGLCNIQGLSQQHRQVWLKSLRSVLLFMITVESGV